MKQVITDPEEGKKLIDRLELERFKRSKNKIPLSGDPVDEAHSCYRYVVVSWLSKQGFDVV